MVFHVNIHYEGGWGFDIEAPTEEKAREIAEQKFDNLSAEELVSNLADISIDDCFQKNMNTDSLGFLPDDGKHSIADGDYPKPNIMLLIFCAENFDSVGGGAATFGTDGKWYWTCDCKISEPCKYTVTHWRYL